MKFYEFPCFFLLFRFLILGIFSQHFRIKWLFSFLIRLFVCLISTDSDILFNWFNYEASNDRFEEQPDMFKDTKNLQNSFYHSFIVQSFQMNSLHHFISLFYDALWKFLLVCFLFRFNNKNYFCSFSNKRNISFNLNGFLIFFLFLLLLRLCISTVW